MIKVALLHFGLEDYTIQLANSLASCVELVLIHPEKVSSICEDDLDPRIRIRTFKKPRSRYPQNFFAMIHMMRIIRDEQPDVLHVQETFDYWYDLTLLFNRMPPLVTTIHDLFRHPGDRGNTPGTEYTKRISFYKSRHLIVHAQQIKEALADKFRIPLDRITVLPHGELGSLYQRRAGQVTYDREPYTLLFFGRIWPYKGLKYLLEAIPLIAKQIPQVKLIIAGSGEDLNQYFPDGYDKQHYEILNEFIPTEKVTELFQRSTITVLPYVEASQSGVAALAYAMGTLVVASEIGGLSELVQHEQDGLLVPPGNVQALANAIVQLLSNSILQNQLRVAALIRCQTDLNWLNIASNTVEIYHKVIAQKSAASEV